VNRELHVTFEPPAVRLSLPVEAAYYRADGTVVARQEMTAVIEPG
jgi:hypothetical protein